ncbi:MAG TPA: ATP-binding protein [Acidimicrobiales bacterium]|nr:ATP-binding protein [Acidimicrobiales bacterium]
MSREAELWLGPDRTGASEARRFVHRIFEAWQLPETLSEDAETCTSELVTNATLHAHTDVYVRAVLTGALVRVEVRDEAPGPVPIRLGRGQRAADDGPVLPATVGRGLRVVDRLADAWGLSSDGRGKTAWFEISTVADTDQSPAHRPGVSRTRTLKLAGIPVRLVRESEENMQELVREAELVRDDIVGPATGAARLARSIRSGLDSYGPVRAALWEAALEAEARGDDSVDVAIEVDPDAAEEAPRLFDLLEQLDDLTRTGQLLTLPAGTDVRQFRRWLADAMTSTEEGLPLSYSM